MEVGLVKRGHTLFGRNAQVVYELQVGEEVEEQRRDQQELKTREQKRKAEDAKRIRGFVHDYNLNKRMSHVQNEIWKLVHHDEHEQLSVWEGCQWGDNKGGWLDPEMCVKARREEVHPSPQNVRECPQRGVPTLDGEGTCQDRMGGD